MLTAKLKHLEFIQNIISRMAHNSFLIKGWTIAIIGAIISMNKDELNLIILILLGLILLMMWSLDAFFLSQERIYRGLYDNVRIKDNDDIDFSMILKDKTKKMGWLNSFFSKTFMLFYGILLASIISLVFYIR